MKTYLSLSGFDSSQIVSLIVKYGVEDGDTIILIRPEVESDTRGELTVQAIRDLSRQIDSSIDLQIFLAFTIACLSQSGKIFKTTNYSDIERSLHEVTLPNITAILEDRQKRILKDVSEIQPTTITDIAERLSVSENTISRRVARLAELGALHLVQKGKTKEVRITLTGSYEFGAPGWLHRWPIRAGIWGARFS